jgi:hypothetical protein
MQSFFHSSDSRRCCVTCFGQYNTNKLQVFPEKKEDNLPAAAELCRLLDKSAI